MGNTSKALEAFERDVPSDRHFDIMTMLAEAAHDDDHRHDCITILDRDHLDAINVRAHGVIDIDGIEHTFTIEDGNLNGTMLLDWDGDEPFERHTPTVWALQPNDRLINEHLAKGQGKFLLLKWDAIIANRKLGDLPQKYAYDRHFQPGLRTENHYREAAAKHGFVLVPKEVADETRAKLAGAVNA